MSQVHLRKTMSWSGALVAVVALVAGCSSGTSDWSSDDVTAAFSAETVDDRVAVLGSMGTPDTFAISWQDVDGHLVQLESWGYHAFVTRVDFADGEFVLTTDLPIPDADTIYPGWYDPAVFTALMAMEDALGEAESASPVGQSPEFVDLSDGGEDMAHMNLYVGDQIMLGFLDQQLVYVETVALAPRSDS